jgi:hypothetical protein
MGGNPWIDLLSAVLRLAVRASKDTLACSMVVTEALLNMLGDTKRASLSISEAVASARNGRFAKVALQTTRGGGHDA